LADEPFIRINLRFGNRTDPAFWHDLSSLSPKDRARWVRTWMMAGWRSRETESIARPQTEVELKVRDPISGAQLAGVPGAPSSQAASDGLDDGIHGFLGQRIL
jgi:hypothetical protein